MVKWQTAAAIATVLGVVVPGALYLSSKLVWAQDYQEQQLEQMTRSDGFELRHVKEEIRELKGERRDVDDMLFNYPGDEKSLTRLDELNEDLEDLEARKCFLMERNGMTCKKRTD